MLPLLYAQHVGLIRADSVLVPDELNDDEQAKVAEATRRLGKLRVSPLAHAFRPPSD